MSTGAWRLVDPDAPEQTVTLAGVDFERASAIADKIGGMLDIYRLNARIGPWDCMPEADYIVTAGPYWRKPGTYGLHQIGSGGFCWDCLEGRDGKPALGLVRHPVTPGEADHGQRDFTCFVCHIDLNPGHDRRRKPSHDMTIPHLVKWGKPACAFCGGGYDTATPAGIGYVEHSETCPVLHGDDLYDAELEATCPRCHAEKGRRCVDEHGRRIDPVHVERWQAWQAARERLTGDKPEGKLDT